MVQVSPTKLLGNPAILLMDKVLTKHGNFKFEKVTDNFFRGSDATAKEYQMMAQQGIEKVLSFKTISSKEAEKLTKEALKYGITFKNKPINPWNPWKYILDLSEELKDPRKTFGHCTFGVDRTSIATGVKQITEGIPMYKVMAGMKAHGYNYLHRIMFFPMEVALRKFAKEYKTIK